MGCGGGGSPALGRLRLKEHVKNGMKPRVIHPLRLINPTIYFSLFEFNILIFFVPILQHS